MSRLPSTELRLKRYVVRIDNYGVQTMLAENLALLLRDLQWLKSQGLSLTILCEEKRTK